MTTAATQPSAPRLIALGSVVVGLLDLLDAFIFFGLRGVSPGAILRSIAAGVLGGDAFAGGAAVLALGLALHFFIAACIVLTLFLLGRSLPSLRRRPIAVGVGYGIAVWCVMNFLVVPLSAAARGPLRPPVVANGLLIHILGVGIPAAWFVLRPFRR
jgi:hypothetical protein